MGEGFGDHAGRFNLLVDADGGGRGDLARDNNNVPWLTAIASITSRKPASTRTTSQRHSIFNTSIARRTTDPCLFNRFDFFFPYILLFTATRARRALINLSVSLSAHCTACPHYDSIFDKGNPRFSSFPLKIENGASSRRCLMNATPQSPSQRTCSLLALGATLRLQHAHFRRSDTEIPTAPRLTPQGD